LDEKTLSAEVIVLGGSIRDGAQGGSRIVRKQEVTRFLSEAANSTFENTNRPTKIQVIPLLAPDTMPLVPRFL
jgi:hypothetical protein